MGPMYTSLISMSHIGYAMHVRECVHACMLVKLDAKM